MKFPSLIAFGRRFKPLSFLVVALALVLAQGAAGQTDVGRGNAGTLFLPEGRSKLVERIVAWVDAEPITLTEVEEALFQYQNDGLVEKGAINERRLRKALERLIDETLILTAAKKAEIKVSAETVDNRVGTMIDKVVEREGGKEKLEATLAKAGKTVEKLRGKLRERTRREMTIALAVGSQVVVTPSDVTTFEAERRAKGLPTERYHLSHLFIPVEPDASEDRWKAALVEGHAVRLEAAREGDFAEVALKWAKSHAALGARGGDMGIFTVDSLKPELARQLPGLEVGSSGPPVRAEKGVHVLYLEGKTTAREILFAQRYEERKIKWAKELRRTATIQTVETLLEGVK